MKTTLETLVESPPVPKSEKAFHKMVARSMHQRIDAMEKAATLIAHTRDNVPVYWGKKESDDPNSRDLTLWVAVGVPKSDGSNYRRVPVQDEIILGQSLEYNMKRWNQWMADRIKTLHSRQILDYWHNTNKN